MPSKVSDETFRKNWERIRETDFALKSKTNINRKIVDMLTGPLYDEYWYDSQDGGEPLYVKIHDIPGTLSGNILRLLVPLPTLNTHSEIKGDSIDPIPFVPLVEPFNYHDEDTSTVVSELPIVPYDETIHFAKASRCLREVPCLLLAKGCPHVVELLGRTDDGLIVFPRYRDSRGYTVGMGDRLTVYWLRRTLLQLTEALISLHSRGIIHRDIAYRNILLDPDTQDIYLCDLECTFGSEICPEISGADVDTVKGITKRSDWDYRLYTEKSDVYMFGCAMTDFILGNSPLNKWSYTSHWVPPAPFEDIARACLKIDPGERPSMLGVKKMLEDIPVAVPVSKK